MQHCQVASQSELRRYSGPAAVFRANIVLQIIGSGEHTITNCVYAINVSRLFINHQRNRFSESLLQPIRPGNINDDWSSCVSDYSAVILDSRCKASFFNQLTSSSMTASSLSSGSVTLIFVIGVEG